MRLATLGGCGPLEIGKLLKDRLAWVHYWRRPTVALMSSPIGRFKLSGLEGAVAKYVADDCRKQHLRDILDAAPDAILFDCTREVYTPILRVGENYVGHPNEIMGLQSESTALPDKLISALFPGAEISQITFKDDRFWPLWIESISEFIRALTVINPSIRLFALESYFASQQMTASGLAPFGEQEHISLVNDLLARMYRHLARVGVTVITVPEAMRITAEDVPWGGPFYTHFPQEAWTCCSESLLQQLLTSKGPAGDLVLAQVTSRMLEALQLRASLRVAQRSLEKATRWQRDFMIDGDVADLRSISNGDPRQLNGTVATQLIEHPPMEPLSLPSTGAHEVFAREKLSSLGLRDPFTSSSTSVATTGDFSIGGASAGLFWNCFWHYPTKTIRAVDTGAGALFKISSGKLYLQGSPVAAAAGESFPIWRNYSLVVDLLSERIGIGTDNPTTTLDIAGPLRVGCYTSFNAPLATDVGPGAIIYLENEQDGSTLAFSNGSQWIPLRAKSSVHVHALEPASAYDVSLVCDPDST